MTQTPSGARRAACPHRRRSANTVAYRRAGAEAAHPPARVAGMSVEVVGDLAHDGVDRPGPGPEDLVGHTSQLRQHVLGSSGGGSVACIRHTTMGTAQISQSATQHTSSSWYQVVSRAASQSSQPAVAPPTSLIWAVPGRADSSSPSQELRRARRAGLSLKSVTRRPGSTDARRRAAQEARDRSESRPR